MSNRKQKAEDFYKEIRPFRSTAIKRAKQLLSNIKKLSQNANPSTTVHLLVEKLMAEPGYREEDF